MSSWPGSSRPSTSFLLLRIRRGCPAQGRTIPGMTKSLIARPLGVVERLEGFLELRRDRDVELLAGRQARDKPFVVQRNQIAIRTQPAEGPFHHRGQLRLTLAEHDAVGVVGQILAGDA